MRDTDRKWFPSPDGPRHRASTSPVGAWFAGLPKWRTVPEDQPVKAAAAVKPKPEPEPVEDDEADTLEGGEHRPRVTLYGVSSEELARMRATQAATQARIAQQFTARKP